MCLVAHGAVRPQHNNERRLPQSIVIRHQHRDRTFLVGRSGPGQQRRRGTRRFAADVDDHTRRRTGQRNHAAQALPLVRFHCDGDRPLIFFPDERTTLKDFTFQLGLIFGLVGMVITIVGDKDFGKMEFNLGVFVVLTAAASWSLLTVLVKKWLPGVSPSFAVSVILTIATPFFLLTDIVMSGGFRIPQTSPYMWAIMIISGILGVGIAHTAYYRSVPVLGVALCASLDLSRPLFVALISYFLYGERLTISQMIGGILLIAGSYLVIKIRFRHIR